jgi:hypothetical protein
MLTTEHAIFLSIVVGFMPYFVKKRYNRGKHTAEIRAFFWSLEYSTDKGWTLRIPFIEGVQKAIWTVVTHLHSDRDL